MVDQVVPITDIASTGVIKDIPSISLPPNAYSDVQNVRFHSGAVRKMEGEMSIELNPAITPAPPILGDVVYAIYWQAPTNNYYIVVEDDETEATVHAYVLDDADEVIEYIAAGTMVDTNADAKWQHTLFNGGFHLVLNNGVSTPMYLSDPVATNSLTELPNWDSYLAQEDVTSVTWDAFTPDIPLGRFVNFSTEDLLFTVTPRDLSEGIINYRLTTLTVPSDAPFSLITTDNDNYMVTPKDRNDENNLTGAYPGDQITISIQTRASINVRAGVIRSYGNLLIAGDLTELDGTDVVRRLPGTIRTSDVAAPGVIPLNWNPFRLGVNTADEFILSSTGRVQDMAELQGVMYVYTDVSIHGIQQTGNSAIPFQISTVTDSYGANSLGAVMEFDGRHLVVGSQDIYVFAGHPGSISSIADSRVRHYVYERAKIDTNNIHMVRNQKYDEIWLFTPSLAEDDQMPAEPLFDEMLVWNYRSQAWTIRKQSNVISGTQGINNPLFADTDSVFIGDAVGKYTLHTYTSGDIMNADKYNSYVARMRLGLTPEFDTETLGSTAIMYTSPDAVDLEITMRGSEMPSDNDGIEGDGARSFTFKGAGDYKVDTRIHGRFINYRISDDSSTEDWNITGYQLEIMKGGKR